MPRRYLFGKSHDIDRKKQTLRLGHRRAERGRCIVAEGDSWFHYILQKDVIDFLIDKHKMPIHSMADPGHMLMDMAYGMDIHERKRGKRKAPEDQQITETLAQVTKLQPKVFLFSGGGNDLAGPELLSYLIHKAAEPGRIDWPRIEHLINHTYANAYRHLHRLVNQKRAGIHFVTHGYAHPYPDGRAAKIGLGLLKSFGPWLRPPFLRMGHENNNANFRDMARMIDLFNDMLGGLSNELANFHHVDLRKAIPTTKTNYEDWWSNELHPSRAGFIAAADAIAKVLIDPCNVEPVA